MKKKTVSRLIVAMLTLCMLTTLVSATLVGCGDPKPQPDAVVESITLDTSAVKTTFEWGEAFNADGLKVIAHKSDKTTEEIALSRCALTKPDFGTPGEKEVRVMYQGNRASYKVTLKERVMPAIDPTAVFEVKGENPNTSYKVEMESINLEATNVKAQSGKTLVTEDESVSGGKYLANYGVKDNYIGFTFTTEQEYKNVTLVMHMSNPYSEVLSIGGSFDMYLNYKGVADTGAIDISAMPTLPVPEVIETEPSETPAEPGVGETPAEPAEPETKLVWQSKVIRNLTLPKGTNTLSFNVKGEEVPNIDYVEFYVGKPYGANSLLEITEKTTYIKEFEDFDLEKIIVREDIKNHHGLKDGQAFVEDAHTNREGTSGGKSVGATMKGSEVSTIIRMAKKATVKIEIACASVSTYKVKDNWAFEMDGELLTDVEDYDIKAGDPGKSQYWMWYYTELGRVELDAGDHMFVVKVTGKDCNVDCVRFTVVGETELEEGAHKCLHACPHCGKCLDETCDYTLCADKCTTHHCEDKCETCGKCTTSCDKGDECTEKCTCPHICEDKCPICGKCTTECDNNSPNGSECTEKCEGHGEYDLAVNKLGSFVMEAENLDNAGVVTRSDFVPSVGQGNYAVAGNGTASGGKSIYALGQGTVFTIKIYVVKAAKITVSVTGASDKNYVVKDNMKFAMDGTPIENTIEGSLTGSTNGNWKTVNFVEDLALEAGLHTLTIEFPAGSEQVPDLDCFTVTATEYDGTAMHVCESVCEQPDCGKCTNTECTDPACADKCTGHETADVKQQA